jgi:hypothetical protein
MADNQQLRYAWYKIITDEFALTEQRNDPSQPGQMGIDLDFNYVEDHLVSVRAKCLFYQNEKLLLVIAVSCIFGIYPEDWIKLYNSNTQFLTLSIPFAQHLAAQTIGVTRGVLHARTENQPLNSIIIPPIDLEALVMNTIIMPRP